MMVLDGRVYRGTVDGRTHAVADSTLTPFAVVVAFRPQGSAPVAAGQSLEQLEAALDALPYSASRVLAARIDGRFQTIAVRSEPKQQPPYRPLPEVIKEQQVVHTFDDVDGTLIGFRFPAATTSVNVPGWHFHFLSADRNRGGHVLGLTTGTGLASLEEFSDLRISSPAQPPRSSAGAEAIKAVEGPQRRPARGRASAGGISRERRRPVGACARHPSRSFCAAPKIGVDRNSVIVRHRAARYKLAPRAGASLCARGCNVFAEEWRRYTGQDQGLPTYRQRALHE
jgi:acetolactate decarboxylase